MGCVVAAATPPTSRQSDTKKNPQVCIFTCWWRTPHRNTWRHGRHSKLMINLSQDNSTIAIKNICFLNPTPGRHNMGGNFLPGIRSGLSQAGESLCQLSLNNRYAHTTSCDSKQKTKCACAMPVLAWYTCPVRAYQSHDAPF